MSDLFLESGYGQDRASSPLKHAGAECESPSDLPVSAPHGQFARQIRKLMQQGHTDEALLLADQAALLPDPSLPLLRQMFNAYKATKSWDQALATAGLITFHKDQADCLDLALPALLFALGRYNESLSALEVLGPKAAANVDFRILTCRNLLATRNYGQATKLAQRIIADYSLDWRGYDLLIDALLSIGKVDEANSVAHDCYHSSQFQGSPLLHRRPAPMHDAQALFPSPDGTLRILQYYTRNPYSTSNAISEEQLQLYNLKLAMQWNASLGSDGTYHLLDFNQSLAFLESWHGPRAVDAFRQCRLPAMQADVIRVAFLASCPHALYFDWPYRPIGRSMLMCNPLFSTSSCILAGKSGRDGWRVWNGFAYNNGLPQVSEVFVDIFENILSNIESRSCNNVFKVTGPAVWARHITRLSSFPCMKRLYFPRDFTRLFQPVFNKRIDFNSHWSVVQETQSIFFEASS